uniref:endo-polygalacturonase n=1 Tax=Mesosa myops TaxID=993118 RepID=A0A6F7XSQ9_9CUCU|nr:endopolygalacturonase [Mesosa myops]
MGYVVALLSLAIMVLAFQPTSQSLNATSCTISKYNADHIEQAQKECTEITIDSIIVPYGVTLDLTKLQKGTKLIFSGTTVWQYAEWTGPLIKIKGTNVEVYGTDNQLFDGRGHLWWDGQGGNGGKIKPKFMRVTVTDSHIHHLNFKNCPVQAFSVGECHNTLIEYISIDNKDGDTQGGHNTDAFNINGSNNVTIQHSTVYNQDDCMAMNSGLYTYFLNNYCSGSHGISIGSVGDGAEVGYVTVKDCQIVNSDNGVRIKTKYGQTGSVHDVLYENIELKNIHKYGIIIQGDYGSSGGKPSGGVPISKFTLKNIYGTCDSKAADVYVIVENASEWHWSDIKVTGGSKKVSCTGIPSGTGYSC